MQKIVAKFKERPALDTAVKVLQHARNHPMTACVYGAEINQAKEVYNKEMGRK